MKAWKQALLDKKTLPGQFPSVQTICYVQVSQSEEYEDMHWGLLLSLLIAYAGALLFAGHKRRAAHRRDLEIMRNRILFGTSACNTDEREKAVFSNLRSS